MTQQYIDLVQPGTYAVTLQGNDNARLEAHIPPHNDAGSPQRSAITIDATEGNNNTLIIGDSFDEAVLERREYGLFGTPSNASQTLRLHVRGSGAGDYVLVQLSGMEHVKFHGNELLPPPATPAAEKESPFIMYD